MQNEPLYSSPLNVTMNQNREMEGSGDHSGTKCTNSINDDEDFVLWKMIHIKGFLFFFSIDEVVRLL